MERVDIELHIHPYFKNYGLEDIIRAMDDNKISIIALEYLNEKAFTDVKKQTKKLRNKGYEAEIDETAVRIKKEDKKFYILKAAEISTKENFHIITIGYDQINTGITARETIEEALKQDALVIFDHPYVDSILVNKEITWNKEKEMIRICIEYSGNLALDWNGYCIPWLRKLFGGRDVNQDTINLSKYLFENGYNVPIVTTTDLHGRNKQALKATGTSRIQSETDTTSGKRIIRTIKQNIFSGKHKNTYETVKLDHFIAYFGTPYIFKKFFERPRG